MVSTNPLISKSSNPFINLLVTLPRVPITIGINFSFMFHSFFIFLEKSMYLSFFSLPFNFTRWSAGRAKYTILKVLFFVVVVFVVIKSGRLAYYYLLVFSSNLFSFPFIRIILSIYIVLWFERFQFFVFVFVVVFFSFFFFQGFLRGYPWKSFGINPVFAFPYSGDLKEWKSTS